MSGLEERAKECVTTSPCPGLCGRTMTHYMVEVAPMCGECRALHAARKAGADQDTGAHYRYAYRAKITDEDIAKGYVEVKLDPYRIADIYDLGGGPREHIVKKGLRGTSKGDSERDLIRQIRDALNRWEEMMDEDEAATCTP